MRSKYLNKKIFNFGPFAKIKNESICNACHFFINLILILIIGLVLMLMLVLVTISAHSDFWCSLPLHTNVDNHVELVLPKKLKNWTKVIISSFNFCSSFCIKLLVTRILRHQNFVYLFVRIHSSVILHIFNYAYLGWSF